MYKYPAIVIGSDIPNTNHGADDDFTGVVTLWICILPDDNYTPGDLKSMGDPHKSPSILLLLSNSQRASPILILNPANRQYATYILYLFF